MVTSAFNWADEPDLKGLKEAHTLLRSNNEAALARLRGLAERGSIMSMLYIGHAVATRKNPPPDYDEALTWYRRAAASGMPFSLYSLCKMLHRAEKFEEELYLLQSDQLNNCAPALNQLGEMYKNGHFVARDLGKSVEYYRKAARGGHLYAMRKLASYYATGRGGWAKIPIGIYLFAIGVPAVFSEFLRGGPESERLIQIPRITAHELRPERLVWERATNKVQISPG